MANLDEVEQEQANKPPTDEVLEALKKEFLLVHSYPYNRQRVSVALEELLQHVRTNR